MVDAADESAGSKVWTKADEDIAEIRSQVASRTDVAAVAKAARMETWADENTCKCVPQHVKTTSRNKANQHVGRKAHDPRAKGLCVCV